MNTPSYGDPSMANPKSHTIGDPSIALAAQQMFSLIKQAKPQPGQGQVGQGLGDPSDQGPSHGKN